MCGSSKSPVICSSGIIVRSSKVVRRQAMQSGPRGAEQHTRVALYREVFCFVLV